MFKFNFTQENDESKLDTGSSQTAHNEDTNPLQPATLQSLDILRESACRISYSRIRVGDLEIPRRDLFDVRFQLMGEDNVSPEDQLLLGDEDVRKSVYEGGLKIWEGSIDLANYIHSHDADIINTHKSVAELGCGAAIPSCTYLYHALKSEKTNIKLVLADYNIGVLRLITMPNLILTWLLATDQLPFSEEDNGELNLLPPLVDRFEQDLQARRISLTFVSGAWSPEFYSLVGPESYSLVLAAETIYSPKTVKDFTDVTISLLDPDGQALVAAKRVYFGVGGTITDFETLLDGYQPKLKYSNVFEAGEVGRVIVRINKM